MFQYQKEQYEIDGKWATPEPYLEKINSSKTIKELLGSPFLLKMFVEALPLMKGDFDFGVLDIYEKFEEHSFDRELRKQTSYVNEIKFTVKDIREFK